MYIARIDDGEDTNASVCSNSVATIQREWYLKYGKLHISLSTICK